MYKNYIVIDYVETTHLLRAIRLSEENTIGRGERGKRERGERQNGEVLFRFDHENEMNIELTMRRIFVGSGLFIFR